MRKRRARRSAIGVRAPILLEAKVNARWLLDFVYDQIAGGRRFRIFNVVDDVTWECLAAILKAAAGPDAARTECSAPEPLATTAPQGVSNGETLKATG